MPSSSSIEDRQGLIAGGYRMRNLWLYLLRISGLLVFAAGTLHLLMTVHLMHWFSALTTADAARAAMMLNHLVAGILLLPLAVSLATIGDPLSRGERWAVAISVADSLALLSLPCVLAFTIRGPMLDAPAFVIAAALLTISAMGVTVAVICLWRGARRPPPGQSAP